MTKTALVYVTDLRGYKLTLHSISSFVLTQDPKWDIYLYCHDFSPDDAESVQSRCSSFGFHLNVLQISNNFVKNMLTKGHVTPTAYLKFLCVLELKGQYDRVLYADNDILFFEAIKLLDFDFLGLPLAAVIDIADCGGLADPTFTGTCLENGISNKYFNSGLMYFNCDELRADETFLDRYLGYLEVHQKFCWYKKNCRTNDQCVLNRLFSEKWAVIPLTYNMQACLKYTTYWSAAAVRHYQGLSKFIPVKLWRDDSRGRELVARVQLFLGYEAEATNGSVLGSSLYWLNAIRQWRSFLIGRRVLRTLRNEYGDHFFESQTISMNRTE